MLNRFFSPAVTQTFSIEPLTSAYLHYEQQYRLKQKNETTNEDIENAWLAIGAEQAKLPTSVLYEFCKDGHAFSIAQHGFIQIVPLSPEGELGNTFTLVHIKKNHNLRPFAREARGFDFSTILDTKDSSLSTNLYVDPVNSNCDRDYLITLCEKYNEKLELSNNAQTRVASTF